MNFFYRLIKNRPTVPRWIIFLLDLTICSVSLLYAYLLRFNMDFEKIKHLGIWTPLLVVTGLNIIFFRIFRTYEGIIRLSSAQEGLRCVSAVFCSSLFLLSSIIIGAVFEVSFIVPMSVLFIYFFIASFLIFSYRILIKELYHRSLKEKLTAENVIVYGKTINGALLKNAIESIPNHQYKVLAFVDNNEKLWGKSIDNAKIYSWEEVKLIAKKCSAKYLFLASDDMQIGVKNEIVDYCLVNNISVKVIPAVQKWVDGHLNTHQIKNLQIEDLLNRPSIKLAPENVQQYLTGKRILITGAAGSIGSEIVRQLAGIHVEQLILCDSSETGLYEVQNQLQQLSRTDENIIIRVCNVRHRDAMENIFKNYKPQLVFHAAAYKHVPLMEMHPCEAVMNNVLGTKIVADLSIKFGVDRFVFISTDKAINPTNVMGATKRVAEMYLGELQKSHKHNGSSVSESFNVQEKVVFYKKSPTKFITTRFGNVLGSNGSVIPRFQQQIDNGGPVTVTHPDITRYFMTIPEACSLVLEAGTMGKGGEIFVFDMGEPVRITDLAHKMIKLAGLIPGKDIQVEFTGLRPGEKLYEELLNKNEEVIATHHKKIMISRVNSSGINNTINNIEYLVELATQNKNMAVVKQMKMIVREFISKNSIYEKLDAEQQLETVQVVVEN
ncbi:polysaccharide biosynthesis protein [Ginsengibacter hankyongi]|uniref:polysaccharide biosynthesis protein n=1 Tax=Ginsengibacter hankyongi TaxID=2607284 RepID=UPI00192937D4|nr:nucleoside-diphosphate sugar epimerase/dehydratase [Ginsengibacter hankyongi]